LPDCVEIWWTDATGVSDGFKLQCISTDTFPVRCYVSLSYVFAANTDKFAIFVTVICITILLLIFTALHAMQTRSGDENSVRPSLRPSVCLSNA